MCDFNGSDVLMSTDKPPQQTSAASKSPFSKVFRSPVDKPQSHVSSTQSMVASLCVARLTLQASLFSIEDCDDDEEDVSESQRVSLVPAIACLSQ